MDESKRMLLGVVQSQTATESMNKMSEWVSRCTSIIIGPGLGRYECGIMRW